MSAIRHPNVVLFMGVCLDPPCMVTEVRPAACSASPPDHAHMAMTLAAPLKSRCTSQVTLQLILLKFGQANLSMLQLTLTSTVSYFSYGDDK